MAHRVRAGFFRCLGRIPLGEHNDSLGLTDAVGKDEAAADDLIRLVGIDPQSHMDLDRLIKLGRIVFLERLDRIREGEWGLGLLLDCGAIVL